MSDDLTLGELARLIERNQVETREGFAAINARLDREYASVSAKVDQAVPLNVYEADKRGTDLRFKNVEDDVASMRATTKWAFGLGLTSILSALAVVVALYAALSR